MGLSQATFDFYAGLEQDNSREYWLAHKADYDTHVWEPLHEVLAELEDEFGSAKWFRANRDVRFSKDKSPYKTQQGAYIPVGEALGWYVQVSARGLITGGGFYHAESAALQKFRDTVAEDGDQLAALLAGLPRAFELGGEELKRPPRGFDADHPQVDLLRHKSLTLTRDYGTTLPANVASAVRRDWRALTPVIDWLDGALF